MGYTPRAEIFDVTTSIPTVVLRMEIWKKARRIADEMIIKAQKRWAQSKNPPRTYQDGDLVWLEGRNLHLDRPAIKLAPKRHGPFKVTRVLSPITYQLELPPQWKIHNVFHIDLLTPYHETDIHGAKFTQPPPDLVDGEEEYEVEEILDSRKHGRGRKVQYLVKWKGYPSSDNQWVNWDDMHAEEALAEFKKQRPEAISHIKRGKDDEQDPSSLMQSNAPTVSPTLLDSPAGSTISNPFIPNAFSVEGQGIEPTVAEAFLSWRPQVPSSWHTPSPSESEGTESQEVHSDDGSSLIFRATGEHARRHLLIPQTLIPFVPTTDANTGNTPFVRLAELASDSDENTNPSSPRVFFPSNTEPIPIPPPNCTRYGSHSPPPAPPFNDLGLLYSYAGDENPLSSIPQGEDQEGQEDGQEAKAVLPDARRVQGAGDACISGDADKWVHADLPGTWEAAGLPTPPEGYKLNRGAAYYPLEITKEDRSKCIADFVKVKWGNDPIICGRLQGDSHIYFDYLHAIPIGLPQPIRTYSKSNVELFKDDHVLSEEINDTVEWIGDVSLKAKLQRWRYEACRLDYLEKERELINTEEWKLQLAHAGTTRRLAGADFEGRLRRGNRGKMDALITEYKRRQGSSNQKRG